MRRRFKSTIGFCVVGLFALSGCGGSIESSVDAQNNESLSPTNSVTSVSPNNYVFDNITLDKTSKASVWLDQWVNDASNVHTVEKDSIFGVSPKGQLKAQEYTVDGIQYIVRVFSPSGSKNYANNVMPGNTKNSGIITVNKKTLLFSGDVSIEYNGSDEGRNKGILKKLQKTLKESACTSIDVTTQDILRNQWIAGDEYTGLQQKERIVVDDSLMGDVHLLIPSIVDIQTEVSRPLEPIPDGVPNRLPSNAPEKPVSTPRINVESPPDTKEVSYQVKDDKGVGCGWDWAKFDNHEPNDLGYQKERVLTQAQQELQDSWKDYTEKTSSDALQSLDEAQKIDEWNSYANTVNNTYQQWRTINQQREKFKPVWDSYVADYNYWKNFDENKKEASSKYQEDVNNCKNQQKLLDEWNKKYKGTSSDLGVPPQPKLCDKEPVKPDIMTAQKPKNPPTKPQIPEGLLIPEQWEQISQ